MTVRILCRLTHAAATDARNLATALITRLTNMSGSATDA